MTTTTFDCQKNFEQLHRCQLAAVKKIHKTAMRSVIAAGAEATKKALTEIVRNRRRPGVSIAAATAAAVEVRDALATFQTACRRDAWQKGRRISWRDQIERKSTASLRKRLDAERRVEIARPARDKFRHGEVLIEWTDDPDLCRVEVDHELDWDGYSKRTKYPMKIWQVKIWAMPMSRADMPGGRRDVDGLVTLAATGEPSPDGQTQLWRAVWMRPGAGVSFHVESGYIAADGDELAHGKTARSAVATLRRRRTMAQGLALARQGIGLEREQLLADYGSLRLRWRHGRRAGLCPAGIESWCTRHFPHLDPRRDSVSVREALSTRTSESLVLQAVALVIAETARKEAA